MSALRAWLDRFPRPLLHLLRLTRIGALALLGPLDWVHRRITSAIDRGRVPPMWLRRHSGPIWAFDRAAGEIAATIAVLNLLQDDAAVLDVGCGCGSMAVEFQRMLGRSGTYVGFDVHGPSIRWCKKRFATDSRFRFELAVLSTAWSDGPNRAVEYRFPLNDGSAGFVLVKSVFTHLLERESQRYLREIRRVLQPGGAALLTAFLLEEGGVVPQAFRPPELTFPYGAHPLWWRVKSRPVAAVAYEKTYFLGMVEAANLRVERLIRGSWSGRGPSPNLQDIIIVK